ncbi:hypothetical protein Tsubulata_048692 [Turnera subulata]|uniref:AB hydrolase-1 domain-containing protein n=1 Tax=Turnera subulata TaxID=218843 RepID=A0A9Q0GBB2_9ROSI|nr:hypothetical protein Tsubulata_048692 [Turnera subulata]
MVMHCWIPKALKEGKPNLLPDRSEAFQARSVMLLMEAHSVRRMSLVGLSYGGFVGYSLAAQFKEALERAVICCAGVCMKEKDLREGVFKVSDLEEAERGARPPQHRPSSPSRATRASLPPS